MQIKVLCNCGTKLAFDAEPIEGRMACAVTCPNCQADITEEANAFIAQALAAVPVTAPVPPPAPASGLSVTRKKAEPTHEAAEPFAKIPEASPMEDSPEARQARRRAEAQIKQAEQAKEWGKLAVIGRIAAVILIALVGAYGWYAFSGSKPKEYYSVKLINTGHGAMAKLKGPEELVVMDGKSVSLHSLKDQKAVWTVAGKEREGNDLHALLSELRGGLFLTEKYTWSIMGGTLYQVEAQTGTVVKETPVPGMLTEITPYGESLVVICMRSPTEYGFMVVNLVTGETKSQNLSVEPEKEVAAEIKNKIEKPATAGNLMNDELEWNDSRPLTAMKTMFTSAGEKVVRAHIKLIKANVVQVKVMSDAPKQSKINNNTSAGSSSMAVAEEVFNDIKRSRGGQFSARDDSTYAVTLRNTLEGDGPSWTGEMTGKPSVYIGHKVNIVTANQELLLLAKDNKELSRTKLTYPMGVKPGLSIRRQIRFPIVETEDTLYVWDKGMLNAFDLSTGNKKWDYPMVGITSVVPDEKGGLYVCGTTAEASSIQFEENIKMQNRPRALFVKLDAKTGKLQWQGQEGANDVYVSGKFLYTTRGAASMLGLMAGESSASHTYIYRVNPSNGRTEWELDYKDHVEQFYPLNNRFVLVTEDTIKVMKFLSL